VAQVVFSSWGGTIIDNRGVSEPKDAVLRLPTTVDGQRELAAFMGWDGIILYNRDVDIPKMAAEYMQRVQTQYVCGKCTPGKKGTRVIMDALARIIDGRGKEADLDTLVDLADLLQNCKCTLCPSSAEAVRHAVTYFRDEFAAYINGHPVNKRDFNMIHKYTGP